MNLLAALRVLWCLAIAASATSLFLYRSSEPHGPDMVASEVSRFVVPLVVALMIAGLSTYVRREWPTPDAERRVRQRRIDTPLATRVIAAAETRLYCTVIVR